MAKKLDQREARRRIGVNPSVDDDTVQNAASKAKQVARLSAVLHTLAVELRTARRGEAYSLTLARVDGREKARHQWRMPWPYLDKPLLILDGTADPTVLRQFIPGLEVAPPIAVRRNACIVQVKDRTFSKVSLIDTPMLEEVGDFIADIARERKTLVVTNKDVRRALTGERDEKLPLSAGYRRAHVAHFGNIRGVDTFKDCEAVIVVGRNELPVREAEQVARALWYDTKKAIRTIKPDAHGKARYGKMSRQYLLKDDAPPPTYGEVSKHPDERVQAVVEMYREAETMQAIDRLRLIHNPTPKNVYTHIAQMTL